MIYPSFCGSLLALIIAGDILAQAAPIYDNGPPDHTNGSDMTRWIEADDFTLTATTRLEGVKFWDFEIPADFAGSVVWQIYSNSQSNSPGTLLFSGTSTNLSHVATGVTVFGAFQEFVNTFDITPVSLPPGTYWLALHNGPLTNNTSDNVFWETTANAGTRPSHGDITPFAGNWISNAFPGLPSEFAFQLSGTLAPRVTAFGFSGGVPQISFTTTVGRNYRVEYKNELTDPLWTPVEGAEIVLGTGNVVQASDLDPNVGNLPRRFYRAALIE